VRSCGRRGWASWALQRAAATHGMAKVKRKVKALSKAIAKGTSPKATDPSPKLPARSAGAIGKKKKSKRKERQNVFLERLKEARQSLSLTGSHEEVLASVKDLAESLPDLRKSGKAAAPKQSKPLTNKARGKLFGAEVSQFGERERQPAIPAA
jgi:hypothetical protein